MVQFRAIKISTEKILAWIVLSREKYCVHEEKIISLTAGDNGNFVSARLAKIMHIFHEFDINLFLQVIFYELIFFSKIVSRTGDLSSTDSRRSADRTTLRTTGLFQ